MLQKLWNKIKLLFVDDTISSNILLFNEMCILVKKSDGSKQIVFRDDVDVIINGKLNITTDRDLNIVSQGNMYIDTTHDINKSKLYINSRMAEQIRNLSTSIEFHERLKKDLEALKKLSDDISLTSISTETEKIKYLEKFIPKEIN